MTQSAHDQGALALSAATVAILMLLGAAGCTYGPATLDRVEHLEAEAALVERLTVDSPNGSIDIEAAEVETITIEAEVYGEDGQVRQSLRGGELLIETETPWWCNRCWVSLTILVPADVSVEVDGGNGDVSVSGIMADTLVDVGNGSINVVDLSASSVELETGSGSVTASAVTATHLGASSNAGSLDLSLDAAPTTLTAHTEAGSQTITVPAGAYDLTWQVGAGSFDFEGIAIDPAAPSSMDLSSGAGSITVRGL